MTVINKCRINTNLSKCTATTAHTRAHTTQLIACEQQNHSIDFSAPIRFYATKGTPVDSAAKGGPTNGRKGTVNPLGRDGNGR